MSEHLDDRPRPDVSNPGPGRVSRLRVVDRVGLDDDAPDEERYDPAVAARAAWERIQVGRAGDPSKCRPAPASARVAALLDAWFVPLRWRESVYAIARRSPDHNHIPAGGVLSTLDSGFIRQRTAARFRRMTNEEQVPSAGALADGLTAFAGTARRIEQTPYVRWGRSATDGALWWDSGGEGFVRVGEDGGSIETEPGAYFLRPTGMPVLPTPERGGSVDRLWEYARIDDADRGLVLAWMCQQADPDYEAATPLLYLTGQHGAAKSTTATVIAMACGDDIERDVPRDFGARPHDFLVSLAGTHVTLLDNLSHLSAQASDVLCIAVTGGTSRQRKLFTDTDVVYLRLRKPMIATSIDLGIVREDLAERMIPIRLPAAPAGTERRNEKRLMTDFRATRAGIFGGLLNLLVDVLAIDPPRVPLPRLAAFGETASRLDAVRDGAGSLARLDYLLAGLAQRAVGEDVFWTVVYDTLDATSWTGTCSDLLTQVDPDGELARRHRKAGWPASSRTLSQRIERIAPTLRAVGWAIRRNEPAGTKRALTWTICPHPCDDEQADLFACSDADDAAG